MRFERNRKLSMRNFNVKQFIIPHFIFFFNKRRYFICIIFQALIILLKKRFLSCYNNPYEKRPQRFKLKIQGERDI